MPAGKAAALSHRNLGLAGAALFAAGSAAGLSSMPPPTARAGRVQAAQPAKVTYRDVAPILYSTCTPCHRPGQGAPFSLQGYAEATRWSKQIAATTLLEEMPPTRAVKGYGEFFDAPRLEPSEIALLSRWVSGGCAPGDREATPPPPKFEDRPLGPPDRVVSLPAGYRLGGDSGRTSRVFVLPLGLEAPLELRAARIVPGVPRVVRSAQLFVDSSGEAARLAAKSGDGLPGYADFGGLGFVPRLLAAGWNPGASLRAFPDGAGFKLRPGDALVLRVSYLADGKAELDAPRVELYTAKRPLLRSLETARLDDPKLRIPAGPRGYIASARFAVPEDETIVSLRPHMQLLGRSFKATLDRPDGTSERLVYVDGWDMTWEAVYRLKSPIFAPKGSTITLRGVYDNSSANPLNPSKPPLVVTAGDARTQERLSMDVVYVAGALK